jgi:type VI secretion system protein ImpK
MDAVYWATAEALIAAGQLGGVRDLPPAERLREEILALLHRMVSRCRQAGIADGEIAEARYAIVAFIDERILKSSWPGRDQWMSNPLQLQLYGEWTAGENFFARMRALIQRADASAALEVYYLCLALGFTGALPSSGATQNLQSYLEAARVRLPRANPGAPISPHPVPNDHATSTKPRPPLILTLVLGCAFVVVVGLGLLAWSLGNTLDRAQRDLTGAGVAHTKAAGTGR